LSETRIQSPFEEKTMNRSFFFAVVAVTFAAAFLALGTAESNAALISYTAVLSGPSSPGTGSTLVDYDDALHTLRLRANFSGLLGTTTQAHIHSPTTTPLTGNAGVATQLPSFSGFPLGVTSGTYDNTFDLTQAASYNPTYVTNNGGTPASAESSLVASFAAGKAYLNIHTSQFSGGEIRGYLVPVPEPSMLAIGAVGALCLMAVVGRRRK
jgi:hypothetical protein